MQSNDSFMTEQQRAVERMMEMNRRSRENREDFGNGHNMPPAPSFVRLNENTQPPKKHSAPPREQEKFLPEAKAQPPQSGFSLPILDSLKIDRDTTLILGLLLILWSEKSDRYLLLALLYILL